MTNGARMYNIRQKARNGALRNYFAYSHFFSFPPAAVGILSVIAQTGLLTLLMKTVGSKHTIMVGLVFEMLQLMWYGFGSQTWMMWAAGVLAAVSR